MRARKFVECVIDLGNPVNEIGAVINVVLAEYSQEKQLEILDSVKSNIEQAIQESDRKG